MMELTITSTRAHTRGSYVDYLWMFQGVFGIVGFTFGWTAGILSLERRHFRFSIMGMNMVLLSGLVTMVVFSIAFGLEGALSGGLLFGLSTMVLSILGLICVAASRNGFS